MTAPFFSIITICRNVEAGLRATAGTLAAQTWRDFEWIIVDGDSSDGTKPFALAQFASGAAIGVSERDRGIYDAMNKGLARAAGDYVLFLNAGDCLLGPSSLATAAGELAAAGCPDIGFFASVMDFGAVRVVRKVKPPSYIWHGQPGLHQATFVKRALHQRFRFRTRYKIVGDYDALARMSRADVTMMSFTPIIGVNQFDGAATSGRNKLRLIREAADVQRRVLGLPYAKILVSAARRAFASLAFKHLTAWRAITRS